MRTAESILKSRDLVKLLSNPDASTLEKIEKLESEMSEIDVDKICPVNDFFGERVYVREFNLPKNFFVTGRVHKSDHVFILVKGDILIWDYHRGVERLSGYKAFESKEGVKRAIIAYSDTIILTAHYAEPFLTIENAKDELSFKKNSEFLDYKNKLIGETKDANSSVKGRKSLPELKSLEKVDVPDTAPRP